MRSWFLLSTALTAAVVASWFHRTAPSVDAAPVNPMLWASDDWKVWTQWSREEAASRCGLDDLPDTEWVRVFSSAEAEVWHAETQWPELPEGWAQQSWRGGWLCGTPLALEMWRAQPGEMSQHWREGETGATLMRTEFGWALKSDGWVVWKDTTQERHFERSAEVPLLAPEGSNVPPIWWAGQGWEAPMASSPVEEALRNSGIPLSSWATRWSDGGRWTVENPDSWRDDIDALATANNWTVLWEDKALVVNGKPNWTWKPLASRVGKTSEAPWVGHSEGDDVVIWVAQGADSDSDVAPPNSTEPMAVALEDAVVLGEVRNHRSRTRMTVRHAEGEVTATQPDGTEVWSMSISEPLLSGGAAEVDVYANGKYQAMFGVPSGLHLIDVKGREVNGFPLAPSAGLWTAWTVVDYDGNRKYRYLSATDASGLVENHRKEGEQTPGWTHRPDASIDISSPVRHIRHVRLGSRDYIYVGRENGQVELLKRNGSTRATTAVLVNPIHPPLFRRGATLEGTSVLFIDGEGWIRERALDGGDEVGMSGATRAEHMEWLDVDGDGRDELITWLRGVRSVWNARNERVD
ncbi:hypothetical protein N9V29_02335 [Flavobacteriales bacterium]|nr:hypothetical protein [Flavobacteriales bacterium]